MNRLYLTHYVAYTSRITVSVAPLPDCRTAAPTRPKSWSVSVSPAVKAAKVVAAKELTDKAGVKVDPPRGVPLRSTLVDNSSAAVVDTL